MPAFAEAPEVPLRFSVAHLDEVVSTNVEIKRLIREGAPEGRVVVARSQTGGYGRQGRSWRSPRGGLYLSVLLRPAFDDSMRAELPTLSLVVALSLREALCSLQPIEQLRVKWPNDVICESGKLCGISLEAIGGAVCLGIGVNVARPDEAEMPPAPLASGMFPPAHLGEIAPSLMDEGFDRALERCETRVLAELSRQYEMWLKEGFAAFVERYNDAAYLTGRMVDVVSVSGELYARGRVVRTGESGALVIEGEGGRMCEVFSGEAHILLS